MTQKIFILGLLLISNSVLAATEMASGRLSDIRETKHNFAANDSDNLEGGVTRNVKASSENQVCVFCHTPHGKSSDSFGDRPFLWNRPAAGTTTSRYDGASSSSFNAGNNPELGQGSKMCLSCHDGTVAIGNIDTKSDITVTGSNLTGEKLVPSKGSAYIGTDLNDDHPVGFNYNADLISKDDELFDPSTASHIGVPVGRGLATYNSRVNALDGASSPSGDQVTSTTTELGGGISIPLEATIAGFSTAYGENSSNPAALTYINKASNGSVECTTCHDPHIRGSDSNTLNNNSINIKFLRLSRFQKAAGTDGTFTKNTDINCIACHDKAGWAGSIHTNIDSATQKYEDSAADARDFPHAIEVWQASCLNCHKPHTSGTDWLLTDDSSGDASDIQQTCLSCHGNSTDILATGSAKNIEQAMLLGNEHGGSGSLDQTKHVTHNGNFDETGAELGAGFIGNRHVVCTDCHNPHRMTKNAEYDGAGANTQSTHVHNSETNAVHSNKASGALRGAMGVEPDYTSVGDAFAPFTTNLSYSGDALTTNETDNVLVGDPSKVADASKHVSKEYQVCLKCHTSYGSTISSVAPNVKKDLAMEFQPVDDAGTSADTGASVNRKVNNHNSWHPVVGATGRVGVVNANNFVDAFDQGIGTQTMYCSDCHNNNGADLNDPADTVAKGPHGSSAVSSNSVMLTAPWSNTTGAATQDDFCFQCHKYSAYADSTEAPSASNKSNFSGSLSDNLHLTHSQKALVAPADAYTCSLCHVNSAHGWKNKGLLVDLNNVDATLDAIYYSDKAKLKVNEYKAPGNWEKADCTAAGCH